MSLEFVSTWDTDTMNQIVRPPDSVFCYSLLTAFADTMKDIDLRPGVHFRDHGLPTGDNDSDC